MDGDGFDDFALGAVKVSDIRRQYVGLYAGTTDGPAPIRLLWDDAYEGPADTFAGVGDVDGDGLEDVVAAAKPRQVLVFRRLDASGLRWDASTIPWPDTAGHAKAVRVGDVDGDGRADIFVTCEGATPPL